jgi:hypothetical protein
MQSKRNVGRRRILAVLFAAWACLPERATQAADIVPESCRRLLTELRQTMAVRVEPNRGRLRSQTRAGFIKAEAVTAADLERAVPILSTELHLYPADFVRLLKLKRIGLCKGLSVEKADLGGSTDVVNGTIYLNVPPSCSRDFELRLSLHHELFHLLDYADDEILFDDQQWSSHNPAGFEYGYAFTAGGKIQMAKASQGFVTDYSLTDPAEDKAEVFSHMIVSADDVERRAKDDLFLKAKMRAMKLRLAGFCCSIDDRFWEAAQRLPRSNAVAATTEIPGDPISRVPQCPAGESERSAGSQTR